MRKILYLADLNSIHDIKWLSYFSSIKKDSCFVISRERHSINDNTKVALETNYNFIYLGSIRDFSIINPIRTLRTFWQLRSIIKKYEVSIFHVFFAEPNALWALVKIILPVRIFLTTRGSDILIAIPRFAREKGILKRILLIFYRIAFSNIDQIISTSESQKRVIYSLFKTQKEVAIIRTGINIYELNRLSCLTAAMEPQRKFIFFPRNMRPIYNHEFAIQAIEHLPEKIKNEFTFVFVDKDKGDSNYVAKIEKLMGNTLGVHFLFLNQLEPESFYPMLKKAVIVVMTPLSDGSPISALETIICQTPLVLPPLDYDLDLFEGVKKFSKWEPQILTSTLVEILTDSQYKNVMKSKSLVLIGKMDRTQEMEKLSILYNLNQL